MLKTKSKFYYPTRIKLISLLAVFSFLLTMFSGITPAYAQEIQTTFYVDPSGGSDENDGTINSPFKTIVQARDSVRDINSSMTGDIEIFLRGGTYNISDKIAFTEADSGLNGYNVIYKAYPGETPILSGGKTITGWELYDDEKNIYSAALGSDIETRQLYVNDIRATRARSEEEMTGTWTIDGNYCKTDYTSILNWGNISDAELVYKQQWMNPRVGLQSVSEDGDNVKITMKQPAWTDYKNKFSTKTPWYIENAYELLDNEGEWYLDRTTDTFYYKPRAGEDMSTAVVTVAAAEQLMTLQGSSLGNPVHNVQFQGISFKYATWLRPSSNFGHIDEQSNIIQAELATSAIDMKAAKSVVFERCNFSKLGGAAINMTKGCQDNLILGCTFTDISASGVQVGSVTPNDNPNSADSRELLKNNDILNSYFNSLGIEYRSSVAIFAAFPMNMDITHNEISSLPYSGMSVGWGWGVTDTSTIGNKIQNNYIHNVMNELYDGAPIYLLGTQHDTLLSGNYLKDQKLDYGAIYLDAGTSGILAENNVIENVPTALFINPSSNNILRSNYSDNYRTVDNGINNIVEPPIYVPEGDWPEPAVAIMSNAGIEDTYEDIIPNPAPNLIPEIPAPGPIFRPEHVQVDFTGKSSLITGFKNGSTLRHNYAGRLGMKITVGNSDMTVTDLGRLMTPGSMGAHDLFILDFETRAEVAKATVDMLGESSNNNGAFKYARLSSPVTLEANKSYYFVSSETPAGDDLWFDGDLKVITTSAATVNHCVFSVDAGEFAHGGGEETTFVGLDLLYDIGGTTEPQAVELPEVIERTFGFSPTEATHEVSTPVDIDGTEGFVSNISLGTPRNDYSGSVGMKVTIGEEDIAVTSLGRIFVDGNDGLHKLRIVDAKAELEVSATIVNMVGGSNNQFKYANLPSPVKLKAGRLYYIVSDEEFGKDNWYDCDTTLSENAVARVDSAAYSAECYIGAVRTYKTYSGTNHSSVGVDFRYTTDTSSTNYENMIHNGDFEEGIAAWETYSGVVTRTSVGTLCNSKGSARVDLKSGHGFAGQGVALEQGKTYELSVWARLEEGTSVARFVIEPNFSLYTDLVPIDDTWRQFKHTFTYNGAAGDFARVQFRVGDGASGFTYYFDDFKCIEVGTTSGGLLTNGNLDYNTHGWTASGCELAKETVITHNESAGSAKVNVTNSLGSAKQTMNFEKGKEYVISAWVRLAEGTAEGTTAKIVADHKRGQFQYGMSESVTVNSNAWTQLTWNYTYNGDNENGLASLFIYLGEGNEGAVGMTYYFDDFNVMPLVDITPLSNAIDSAIALKASKNVGYAIGYVPLVAINTYQSAIDAAILVKNNSVATQQMIENQITELATATEALNNSVITEVNGILNNGKFETNLNGWNAFNCELSRETAITHNSSAGSAKVKVTGTWGSGNQAFDFKKGKEYNISVWVRLAEGTAEGTTAKIVTDHMGGSNQYGESASVPVNADTWTQLNWTYKYEGNNDNGLGMLFVYLGSGNENSIGKTYYMDDFMVTPTDPNIIVNGDFEANTNGWTTSGGNLVRETAITNSGSAGSAKVTPTSVFGHVEQWVELEKGKEYEVSAWVKLDTGDSETNTAKFVFSHGDNEYGISEDITLNADTWTHMNWKYTYTQSHQNGNGHFWIFIGDGTVTNRTFYFDDVVIKPAIAVDKAALTTAIANAEALIASKTVGTEVGNVPQAAKDAFQSAIAAAKLVKEDSAATQEAVDSQETALAAATIAFNSAVITESNIIVNGDFEANTNGWTMLGGDLVWETAITNKGSVGSAKVTPSGTFGHAEQWVELEKGKEYEVSAWVKLDSGEANTAKFVFSHGDNEYGMSEDIAINADTWTHLNWKYTYTQSHQNGNGHFWIFLGDGTVTNRTFYFDDVVIKPAIAVDKAALITAIANAEALIASKTVGTEVGNVPQAAKDAFQSAIAAAKLVNEDSAATQEAVDSQETALAAATIAFNSAVIMEVSEKFAVTTSFKVGSTNNATSLSANQMVTANSSITNNQSTAQLVMMIVALYDNNGDMVNLSYIAKTIQASSSESFNAGFRLPSVIAGYQVKAFVWEGTDPESSYMTPISNVVVIQ